MRNSPGKEMSGSRSAGGAGSIVLWLLRNPGEWVHRRVETLAFVDDRWIRRRVSLDCTLPEVVAGQQLDAVLGCIPLVLLAKRALRAFDLRDASGRALSLLTTDENTDIAHQALLSFAEQLCGEIVEDDVSTDLRAIVGPIRGASRRALGKIYYGRYARATQDRVGVALTGSAGDAAAARQRQVLAFNRDFMSILDELAHSFLLLTPRLNPAGGREIFKYSYEEPLTREREILRKPAVLLGLTGARLVLPLQAAESALSFHCEIEAPPDLEITKAKIDRGVVFAPELEGLNAGQRLAKRREARDLSLRLEARDGGGLTRAHLQLPRALTRAGLLVVGQPQAVVWLRSRRAGFLRPAAITCLLATALLTAGRARLSVVSSEVEPASTLILLVPGLLAAYLSRPGEHVLASSLLLGVRVMLIISGLCTITAAALLLARLSPAELRHDWTIVRDLSVVATMAVIAASLLPIRHSRWAATR